MKSTRFSISSPPSVLLGQMSEGRIDPSRLGPNRIDYASLAPEHIADPIVHAIDHP